MGCYPCYKCWGSMFESVWLKHPTVWTKSKNHWLTQVVLVSRIKVKLRSFLLPRPTCIIYPTSQKIPRLNQYPYVLL
jgi:hypothetical protein